MTNSALKHCPEQSGDTDSKGTVWSPDIRQPLLESAAEMVGLQMESKPR